MHTQDETEIKPLKMFIATITVTLPNGKTVGLRQMVPAEQIQALDREVRRDIWQRKLTEMAATVVGCLEGERQGGD